ncbi:MAG: aspartate carbamoyltransferase, partial [Planctomycetota bacterium]
MLGTRNLSRSDILSVLDVAGALKKMPPARIGTPLKGKRMFNFFSEPSTRTKTSFTLAARKLGCEVLDFSPSSSSLSKGETLIDTAKTIESM